VVLMPLKAVERTVNPPVRAPPIEDMAGRAEAEDMVGRAANPVWLATEPVATALREAGAAQGPPCTAELPLWTATLWPSCEWPS
jgi:hypothetical protein